MSSSTKIPVIDISGSVSEAEVARALVGAVASNGFVYVRNLGQDIPIEVIDRTFDLVMHFENIYIYTIANLDIVQEVLFLAARGETDGQDYRKGRYDLLQHKSPD